MIGARDCHVRRNRPCNDTFAASPVPLRGGRSPTRQSADMSLRGGRSPTRQSDAKSYRRLPRPLAWPRNDSGGVSLRGGRSPTWQSNAGSYTGLPRPLAWPRNDSGGVSLRGGRSPTRQSDARLYRRLPRLADASLAMTDWPPKGKALGAPRVRKRGKRTEGGNSSARSHTLNHCKFYYTYTSISIRSFTKNILV